MSELDKSESAETGGARLLVSVQQKRDIRVALDSDSDGTIQTISGPLDLVQWDDMHLTIDSIRAALVRAGLVNQESLYCEAIVARTGERWDPQIRLFGKVDANQIYDLEKITAVAEMVVTGLKRSAADSTPDLFTRGLTPIEATAVHNAVIERLNSSGGKKLSAPVEVSVDQSVLLFDGKLGAKASRANFQAERQTFEGIFFGFDGDRCELFFQKVDGKIKINFAPDQVDLLEITRAYVERRNCTVVVHRTVDKNGTDVHAFVPEVPFLRKI